MGNQHEENIVRPNEISVRPLLGDWRVVGHEARRLETRFRTGSMVRGLELVERIVAAAEEVNHHPDLDLRYPDLHVSLTTHSAGTLTEADADLAVKISGIAREMGIEADPTQVTATEIAIDALDIPAVVPFWQAVLGYDKTGDDLLDDPAARGPAVWFQQMDEPRPQRNRVHLDVYVPHDHAESRLEAALAAGGRLVTDEHAPAFWVLADAEGNEACICTWQGND